MAYTCILVLGVTYVHHHSHFYLSGPVYPFVKGCRGTQWVLIALGLQMEQDGTTMLANKWLRLKH